MELRGFDQTVTISTISCLDNMDIYSADSIYQKLSTLICWPTFLRLKDTQFIVVTCLLCFSVNSNFHFL